MTILPALKTSLRTLAPGVAIGQPRTMDDLVAASVAQPRFRTLLLAIFAAVSLLLASVGLYGVVAFSVNQRRTELGLRVALGAEPGEVMRLVLRQGMVPVAVGMGAGLGGAVLLARVMKSLLFGVEPGDPATFGGVAILLTLVALAACYLPARRATVVDPATTLR
jgi:putative ABC transport system permease protein